MAFALTRNRPGKNWTRKESAFQKVPIQVVPGHPVDTSARARARRITNTGACGLYTIHSRRPSLSRLRGLDAEIQTLNRAHPRARRLRSLSPFFFLSRPQFQPLRRFVVTLTVADCEPPVFPDLPSPPDLPRDLRTPRRAGIES